MDKQIDLFTEESKKPERLEDLPCIRDFGECRFGYILQKNIELYNRAVRAEARIKQLEEFLDMGKENKDGE